MPKTIAQPYTKTIGVGFVKSLDTWRVFIRLNGKQVSLGNYDTEIEAICARMGGELIYLGEVITKPTLETQGFYDTMMTTDNPYWYATAAVRSKIKCHEGVNFNKDHWVSYSNTNNQLKVLGYFKTYMEAYTQSQLDKSNFYEKED